MPLVEFNSEEKAAITQKLQRYLADELEVEIGGFDAEFLLDFSQKRWVASFTTEAFMMHKLFSMRALKKLQMPLWRKKNLKRNTEINRLEALKHTPGRQAVCLS